MNRYKFFVITLVIGVLVFALVQLLSHRELPIGHSVLNSLPSYYSYAGGKQIIVSTPLVSGPPWVESSGNPPLSARNAIRLAVEKRKAIFADRIRKKTEPVAHEWKLQHAILCPADAENGQWYWAIDFKELSFGSPEGGITPSLRLVVLMDGTVVEPEIKNFPVASKRPAFQLDENQEFILVDTLAQVPQNRVFWLGTGSIAIETRETKDEKLVFRYVHEQEGGYTVYHCIAPASSKPIKLRKTLNHPKGQAPWELFEWKPIRSGDCMFERISSYDLLSLD